MSDSTSDARVVGEIGLRPLNRTDYPTLARWRRDRAWLTWWGPERDEDELEEDYGPTIDGAEPTHMFIVVEDGRDVGLVETYRLIDHPEWQAQVQITAAAGIDYGIGHRHDRGRGVGKVVLGTLVDLAFEMFQDCASVVAVPKSANVASCAVLSSVGFRLVEVKHLAGEWPAEGTSSIYRLDRPQ